MAKRQQMQRYFTTAASFLIMLSLGGVYSWSIIAAELVERYSWSTTQTQLVFGLIITVFPSTMLLAGKLERRLSPKSMALVSALFFGLGYILAGFSGGKFIPSLLGLGVLAGIGTGFGYSVAITTPVKWFPDNKGLITGVASAGFGLASVVLSNITERFLLSGKDILQLFTIIGIVYTAVILVSAFFLVAPLHLAPPKKVKVAVFLKDRHFYKLFFGIFFGTFAGLLIIGNLSSIGSEAGIADHLLVLGVSLFAIANFLGRLIWGVLSDKIGGRRAISMALLFQAVAILLLGLLDLNPVNFTVISALIGFGFGSNFVLFAKETSHNYGLDNFGKIYPYVFLGYAIAGISGPLTGGLLHDIFNNFHWGIISAFVMSLIGGVIFLGRH